MHRKCGTALPARPLDLKLALFLNLHSDLCRYAAQEHCYVATVTAVNDVKAVLCGTLYLAFILAPTCE